MNKTWLAELWTTTFISKSAVFLPGRPVTSWYKKQLADYKALKRRRGGQGRIATSGTTQPLKRDLMLEWALTIGVESFLCICFYVCWCVFYGRKKRQVRRQVSIESEVMKDRGEKRQLHWRRWSVRCVLCNSASYVNRSVIRNSKHMPSWERPISLSLVLHTAHIMHCIKYLLVFGRRGLHFLQRNNQNKNREAFACVFKAWMASACALHPRTSSPPLSSILRLSRLIV